MLVLFHGGYRCIILLEKCGRPDLNVFHLKWIIGTHGNWNNQNHGGLLELPSKQCCQFSPFTTKMGQNGLNWQCCLAGSSKTAPRILIFFNCHGCQTFILAEIHCQLSTLKSWHNNLLLSGVICIHKYYAISNLESWVVSVF